MNDIAIILPTYKPKEYYLKRCFESLNNQSLSKNKFTVYIGLNGERNQYERLILNLLKCYSFKYKYVYISKSGVSNARNILLDKAGEEYVTFIDDDDCVSFAYLNNLLSVSEPSKITVSNVMLFSKDIKEASSSFLTGSYERLSGEESNKFTTRKFYSPVCGKLIHRNAIDNIKFDTNIKNGEDSLFMAMISKNINSIVKANNQAIYYVYERENSASRKKILLKDKFKNYYYLCKIYISLLNDNEYDKIFIMSRIAATLKKMVLRLN